MKNDREKRLIIGITGASGVVMGVELLRALRGMSGVETHLIMTEGAVSTLRCETELSPDEVMKMADQTYDNGDMTALVSSGSFRTEGMIVLPCSMKTAAGIASGFSSNLLLRAADVCLKEGRKLVLVPREMPLSPIHLRNLKELADCGCSIVPPVLTFYNGADTLEKQVRHILGKILVQFGLQLEGFCPWDPGFAYGKTGTIAL